nr:hypothetical protein [Candidatus Sigynarchaeum springense]
MANVLVFSTLPSTPLITSLGVDTDAINVTVVTRERLALMSLAQFNTTLALADVIFVDRFLPGNISFLDLLVSHVNGTLGNDGLVMFGILQKDSTPGNGDFTAAQVNTIAPLLPVDLAATYVNSTSDSASIDYSIQVKVTASIPTSSSILTKYIPWGTCPLIDRRVVVEAKPGATPVITDLVEQKSILSEWVFGPSGARVMFFSMEITENNIGFTVFPYFNYLMYVCTFHVTSGYSDDLIESWEEWPYSPIPRGPAVAVWFVMIGALWIITFWIYFKNKKRGKIDSNTIAARGPGAGQPAGGTTGEGGKPRE